MFTLLKLYVNKSALLLLLWESLYCWIYMCTCDIIKLHYVHVYRIKCWINKLLLYSLLFVSRGDLLPSYKINKHYKYSWLCVIDALRRNSEASPLEFPSIIKNYLLVLRILQVSSPSDFPTAVFFLSRSEHEITKFPKRTCSISKHLRNEELFVYLCVTLEPSVPSGFRLLFTAQV